MSSLQAVSGVGPSAIAPLLTMLAVHEAYRAPFSEYSRNTTTSENRASLISRIDPESVKLAVTRQAGDCANRQRIGAPPGHAAMVRGQWYPPLPLRVRKLGGAGLVYCELWEQYT